MFLCLCARLIVFPCLCARYLSFVQGLHNNCLLSSSVMLSSAASPCCHHSVSTVLVSVQVLHHAVVWYNKCIRLGRTCCHDGCVHTVMSTGTSEGSQMGCAVDQLGVESLI